MIERPTSNSSTSTAAKIFLNVPAGVYFPRPAVPAGKGFPPGKWRKRHVEPVTQLLTWYLSHPGSFSRECERALRVMFLNSMCVDDNMQHPQSWPWTRRADFLFFIYFFFFGGGSSFMLPCKETSKLTYKQNIRI